MKEKEGKDYKDYQPVFTITYDLGDVLDWELHKESLRQALVDATYQNCCTSLGEEWYGEVTWCADQLTVTLFDEEPIWNTCTGSDGDCTRCTASPQKPRSMA